MKECLIHHTGTLDEMPGVIKDNKVYIKWTDGKLLLPEDYFIFYYESENGLTQFSVDGKWGFADVHTGEIVITATWDYAGPIYNGYAHVARDGRHGYIDYTNTVTVPLEYDDAEDISDHLLFRVAKDNRWGVVDKDNKVIIPLEYDYVYYSYGYDEDYKPALFFSVEIDERYGVIGADGKKISQVDLSDSQMKNLISEISSKYDNRPRRIGMDSISREEIIDMIRKEHLRRYGNRGNITLPKEGYDFTLIDNSLYMKIREVEAVFEKKVKESNMQNDCGAFDTWAVGIKSWINEVDKVVLSWDKPEDIHGLHYQRFLYRVTKSMEIFDWLVPANDCAKFLDDLKLKFGSGKKYISNAPTEEAEGKAGGLEAIIEREFAANYNKELAERVGMDNDRIFHQLPVGIFKDKVSRVNAIFPGGSASIDLWGINKAKEELHIFELKAKDNTGSGIYSQLFFYSILQHDILNNYIARPKKLKGNNYRGYHELLDSEIASVKSHFLVNRAHPLIDEKFIEFVNFALKKSGVAIEFDSILYDYNDDLVIRV